MTDKFGLTALGSLGVATQKLDKANQRLSSGKRINNAADDAAGLAIADSLATYTKITRQANNNISYGDSALQISQGALTQITDITGRLSELAEQAANGTLSDTQRNALNQEYSALKDEANRIAQTTSFNGRNLFDGNELSIQAGSDAGSNSQLNVPGVNLSSVLSGLGNDISSQANAQAALTAVKDVASNVSEARGAIGAVSSRLQTASNNNAVSAENAAAAESRIRDADIATEVANRTSASILQQSSIAALAHYNLSQEQVSRLLQ